MLGSVWADAALIGVLGLLVGSFLNVVIHRLPKMLQAQWAAECAELTDQAPPAQEKLNLLVPRSRCPKCGHVIRWYENIPVVSYLALRGKCSACGAGISLRYPAVELVTGALFLFCAVRWGWSANTAAWCIFCAVIVALASIDWDTTLLPDDMTLPLVWLGLIVAALRWNPLVINLSDALWGAVAGYMSLWLVYWAFKLVTGESSKDCQFWQIEWWIHRADTGKEGMGYGDFKLFAALGAWFGWQGLVPIILMSSVIGAIVGIAMKFSSGLREGGYIPFGPFLAGAGLTALLFGPQAILRVVGL
jgi:leader peptidase (prepilin peptidase) / N-methyltransferase